MDTFIRDVRDFHEKFDLHDEYLMDPERVLHERLELLQSEVDELAEAQIKKDIVKIADALGDILYVAIGTVAMMRLPISDIWDEIQRSNMAKERIPPGEAQDTYHKVRKPSDWQPPDIHGILLRHLHLMGE